MDEYNPQVPRNTSVLKGIVLLIVVAIIGVGAYFLVTKGGGLPWLSNTTPNTNLPHYTGGPLPSVSVALQNQSSMGTFQNLDELKLFLEEHQGSGSSDSYDSQRMFLEESMALPNAMPQATMGLGAADLKATPDYSTTNIQVAGVDEADIIKTDGTYIYAVSAQNVFIIKANPASSADILATIVLDSTPQDIYINGDMLVIYGQESYVYDKPFYDLIRPNSSYTFFKVFDLKDRENPKQVRDLEFEGYYTNSRMIGDYVYFITSHPTYSVYPEYPLPLIVEDEKVLPLEASSTSPCNCPDMYYIDMPYENYNFTTVAAINVADNTKAVTSDVYLLSAENIYVSEDNLYIAYTKYISEYQLELEVLKEAVLPRLSDEQKAKIQEIEAAPSYVLTKAEKEAKIQLIITQYVQSQSQKVQEALQSEVETRLDAKYADISQELEKTVIHKIAVDGDSLNFVGSGEVTGHVLNQFAMDEHEGNFRIATTKNRTWTRFSGDTIDSYNNVFVLDANMKQIGKVENLAKGEQIYSVRFMQGRAYLVTFRQIDPLFVIDLSSPTNPKVLGELKVPGFSSYLHPYDETTLIGFGKQATDEGIVEGLKLSLFDVSDVANLKEIDTYEMGNAGSDSLALNDHKAFLFSKDKNLLVVPVSLRDIGDTGDYFGSSWTHGAMVFTVTKEGFTFRDRIDHSDGSGDDEATKYYYGYSYYDTQVKRSLYIDDTLFTLSDKYLKANGLGDLEEITSLTLKVGDASDDYTIIR